MPITVTQPIYVSLTTPAPQNPALSGYAVYGDIDQNKLIFDNISGRGWFTQLNSESNLVPCLLGPIACTTHISTALSRVYWREEAVAITNEAVLVLDRENIYGQFKVQVPTTFTEPLSVPALTVVNLDDTYLICGLGGGILTSQSLAYVSATTPTNPINVTSGWVNATNTISLGTSGSTTKWLVQGHVTITSGTNNDDLGVRLYNTSTSSYLASTNVHITHATEDSSAHLSAIVIVTDVDVLALQVTSAQNNGLISVAPNGAGSKGVGLTAVRLG